MSLKPVHFLPGDIIIEAGTIGEEMFFISSGTVEVDVDGKIISVLNPGQFFGEVELLFGLLKRTATVRAITNCRLYSLSRRDLLFILEVYPEVSKALQDEVERRLDLDIMGVNQ